MTNPEMLDAILGQLAKLRDPGGYYNAGLPNYDHLFGRDSCVTALQLLHRDPEVAKATLRTLAKYQGRKRRLRREEWPGKIMHEHYPYGLLDMLSGLIHNHHRPSLLLNLLLWRFPYYGSVDAGAWFMILLHHYYCQTKDEALVRELWPNLRGIVHWYDRHGTHRPLGLVTFRTHYLFGLQNQSWKDTIIHGMKPPVAMVEVQGYYHYALKLAGDLSAEVMHDEGEALSLRGRANTLKADFQSAFQPVDGVIPLAVDGTGRRVAQVVSNIGHLLFTGILSDVQAEAVVRRLFAADMSTPYGIRTLASTDPEYDPTSYQSGSVWPFDNWVIHQGLLKTGHEYEAKQLSDGLVKVFEDWKLLPELYAVGAAGKLGDIKAACRIQAWSAGALINMLDAASVL